MFDCNCRLLFGVKDCVILTFRTPTCQLADYTDPRFVSAIRILSAAFTAFELLCLDNIECTFFTYIVSCTILD